eukprot:6486195-Amphidinium_carterae.1
MKKNFCRRRFSEEEEETTAKQDSTKHTVGQTCTILYLGSGGEVVALVELTCPSNERGVNFEIIAVGTASPKKQFQHTHPWLSLEKRHTIARLCCPTSPSPLH